MAAILQKTFSFAFSSMKDVIFWFKIHLNVFPQQAIIDLDDGLAPKRWQAIIRTNNGLVHPCIYESLGLNELMWTSNHSVWAVEGSAGWLEQRSSYLPWLDFFRHQLQDGLGFKILIVWFWPHVFWHVRSLLFYFLLYIHFSPSDIMCIEFHFHWLIVACDVMWHYSYWLSQV